MFKLKREINIIILIYLIVVFVFGFFIKNSIVYSIITGGTAIIAIAVVLVANRKKWNKNDVLKSICVILVLIIFSVFDAVY